MKKLYTLLLLVVLSFTATAQQTIDTKIATSNEAKAAADVKVAADAKVVAEVATEVATATEVTPDAGRKGRGLATKDEFVARGQWTIGGSASYSVHRNQDFKLLVIDNINSEGYTFKVSPMIAFAPCKNMSVGVRFGYARTMLSLDSASLSFGEGDSGVNIDVDMFHQIKHTYTGTLFWRPYIPLGHSKRFALFAEVQLNLSGSQAKNVMDNGMVDIYPDYRGSYVETFGASIGVQPGIMAFLTNTIAFEVSVGMFNVGYDRITQIRNQVDSGTTDAADVNFKVNLLDIGFGVSFYL